MEPRAGARPHGPGDAAGASTHRLSLPPEASSASRARQWLRQVLVPAGREGWLDTAELACTELVTNALLHAHTPVDVAVHLSEDSMLVEVHDLSPTLPVQRAYDSLSTTGRGMGLVAALVSEHGIRDAGPDGKTAWFVVRGEAGAADADDLLSAWDDSAWDDATRDAVHSVAGPSAEAAPAGTVRLLGLPPTLWFAARQHHDAILRELALHLAEETAPTVDLAAADRARSAVSTALWALVDSRRRHPDGAGAGAVATAPPAAGGGAGAVPAVLEPVDLAVTVPTGGVGAFARLQDTLDLAEGLAAAGVLFTRPALPEIVAVRDWACEQVLSQHAGAPPVRWAGADQDVFVAAGAVSRPGEDGWDLEPVRESAQGVAAADSNRIVAVSRPLARLLGWEPQQLVGRRIVTLVPPRFREAHVAGFTRHLATGETTILGTPVALPVFTADGVELLCRVLIEAVTGHARGGRFLAWIEPADPGGAPGR